MLEIRTEKKPDGVNGGLFILLLVAVGGIFWLDMLTGPVTAFAPYYIIAIGLSTWLLGRPIAYLFIVLASLARMYESGSMQEQAYYLVYGSLQSFFVYATFEILISKVKLLVENSATHTAQLNRRISCLERKSKLDSTIRLATPEDLEGVMRLVDAAAESGVLDTDIRKQEQRDHFSSQLKKWIEDGFCVRNRWSGEKAEVAFDLWVSVMDSEVAGIAMVMGVDGRIDIKRELHLLVVREEFRGTGLGSSMLDFFCTHYANHQLFVACQANSRVWEMIVCRRFTKFSNATHGYTIFWRPD